MTTHQNVPGRASVRDPTRVEIARLYYLFQGWERVAHVLRQLAPYRIFDGVAVRRPRPE